MGINRISTEWTDSSWSPIVGVSLDEDTLSLPLHWKKPRRIFVNSMSDLFHESLPDEAIDEIFAVMALAPQHIFQVLTKRVQRMQDYIGTASNRVRGDVFEYLPPGPDERYWDQEDQTFTMKWTWPLPNVWLGISCECQQEANERIPHLRETSAAVRFISFEPLLEEINVDFSGISWAIISGEIGPGARPMDLAWARSIVMQCKIAGTACFVKQLGANPCIHGVQSPAERRMGGWDRNGGDMNLWPEDLRIQEFPQ